MILDTRVTLDPGARDIEVWAGRDGDRLTLRRADYQMLMQAKTPALEVGGVRYEPELEEELGGRFYVLRLETTDVTAITDSDTD